MELLSINTGEEKSVRVESSERIAREHYSREGPRVESKPVQSSDDGPFFSFSQTNKLRVRKRNGRKQRAKKDPRVLCQHKLIDK